MSKNILITGGSGYLAQRFIKFFPDAILGARRPLADQVLFDLNDPKTFAPALTAKKTIIHLAALDYQDCERDPELAQKINVEMVSLLLREAIEANVKRIIYFSTIHVYGAPLVGQLSESSKTNPASVYAKTHLAAEEILLNAHREKKIEVIIIRLSNGMGAPLDPKSRGWQLVVNDLGRSAVLHKKILMKSSGLQKRDFIDITTIAKVLQALVKVETLVNDPVFNLGSGEVISIYDLALKIQSRCQKVLGFTPPIQRPSDIIENPSPEFRFVTDKLQKLVPFKAELEAEIDLLLQSL